MSKKTIISLISIAAVIIAAIAVAISFLYKEKPVVQVTDFQENHPLITCVPSDAAIVFCVKDFKRAQEYACDSTAAFGQLFSGFFDRLLAEDYPSLNKDEAVISIHYSKDMPPLLVIDASKEMADSANADIDRLLGNADSLHLAHKEKNGRIMISPSETIVNSSIRHQSSGHSILESDGFRDIASIAEGEDIIFISNAYSDKIIDTFFSRKHHAKASFIKEISKWSAFTIDSHSENGVQAHGAITYSSDPSWYTNVLQHSSGTAPAIAEVLPSNADYAISLPISSIISYSKAYRNYLDSQVKLDKFEATLKEQKKEYGMSAEDWAKNMNITEAAIAGMHIGDNLCQMLLIRPGKEIKLKKGINEYDAPGFAQTMFGSIFKADEENSCIMKDGWIIVGDSTALKEYSKPDFMDENLSDFLDDCELKSRVPQKNCAFFLYYSMGEDPTLLDATFSKPMAMAFRNILKGTTFAPMFLSAGFQDGAARLSFNVDRVVVTKSKAPSIDRDTTVVVPSGPYKVKNSATGKENKLYQNRYKSICLQDENGKDVWGIPFKEDICGYVETIDYYNNGKLQFLFAAGSKLYLLDRLGRFVSGFPVDLGKKIALGPKVYDFTGAHGYRAMVLFSDNTIGFTNLHGDNVEGWKGFKVGETIKQLPELVKTGKESYWIVRTSRQVLVFPFMGGESLVNNEGEKMIRPDSKVEFDEKGSFVATCYDGKERTFKIKK
jgi:hypothetical protein